MTSKYSQYEFAKYLERKQAPQEVIDLDVYLNRMLAAFENEMCLDYEDQHLEDNYPEFKDLMKEYHDGILLFNLTDEKVWSKAVIDTSVWKPILIAHNSEYMWEETSRCYSI